MPNKPISVVETPVWVTSLYTVRNPVHDQIVTPIKKYIYDTEATQNETVATGIAANIKHGLFESRFDFFDVKVPAIETLKSFCAAAVMEVVKHVNADSWTKYENFSLEFRESWFHVTRHGGYHDLHNHPNCSWCGIYYLDIGDATKADGSNAFFDPRPAAHNYTDYGTVNYNEHILCTHFSITPHPRTTAKRTASWSPSIRAFTSTPNRRRKKRPDDPFDSRSTCRRSGQHHAAD